MHIVADEQIPFVKELFAPFGDVCLLPGRTIKPQDVVLADILLIRSVTNVNAELLTQSNVKFVGSMTAGADHLDTEWLNAANIKWQTIPGFNAQAVADYVLSVYAYLQIQKILKSRRLRIGIIGVGHTGRLVAQHFSHLNHELFFNDPIRAQQEKNFISTPFADLNNLDLLSLHVPLTTEGEYATKHLINSQFLQKQKQNLILINTSRGEVLNIKDLVKHKQGHWCFDVWNNEPHVANDIVDACLIATPHIAGYSIQSKRRGIYWILNALKNSLIRKGNQIGDMNFPHQLLDLENKRYTWQEVLLKIFNPLDLSAQMHAHITAKAFDDLRTNFNSRYELAYITLKNANNLPMSDRVLLRKFGIKIL